MCQVEGWEVGCGGQKSASQPLLRGPDSSPKNTFSEVKVKIRNLASGKEESHQGLRGCVCESIRWRLCLSVAIGRCAREAEGLHSVGVNVWVFERANVTR